MSDSVRRPSEPPDPGSADIRREWESLTSGSLARMRSTADKWRDGLAGLVTVVTAGLVIAGPDQISGSAPSWRLTIIILMVGGLLLAVAGLVYALRAAAGNPQTLTFEEFQTKWLTRRAVESAEADRSRKALRNAQRLAIPGLVCIVLGTGAWLASPPPKTSPPAFLQVTSGTEVLCGELTSGDGGDLVISVEGRKSPAQIPYRQVQNLRVVSECENS